MLSSKPTSEELRQEAEYLQEIANNLRKYAGDLVKKATDLEKQVERMNFRISKQGKKAVTIQQAPRPTKPEYAWGQTKFVSTLYLLWHGKKESCSTGQAFWNAG